MPLVGLSLAPFALYVITGMPADSALLIGATNAVAETTVEFVGWVDRAPVQAGVGRPSSAAASANPYWVGVKNALSVTWHTNVNFHLGVVGKLPAAAAAVPDGAALLELDELHAAIRAEAAAVALNRPAPSSSRRREGPSCMCRGSIASSTTGSIFFLI